MISSTHIRTWVLCLAVSTPAMGQSEPPPEAAQEATGDTGQNTRSVIDDVPFLSPRAAAMSGAVGPVADDIDSAFHNPAGIGGLSWGKSKMPWFRKIYLPRLGAAANENSTELNKAFKDQGGADDTEVGQAIVDAAEGEGQYARANYAAGFVLGRMMLMPFGDYQMAAVSQGDGTIDAHYRSVSGVGYGLSFASFDDSLYLGYFGYSVNVSETKGLFDYQEIIDTEARKAALEETTAKYAGVGHNVGLIWRLGEKATPTLSLSSIHLGDTALEKTGGVEDETLPESLTFAEDLRIGFAVSPKLGKSAQINTVLEAAQVDEEDLTIAEKLRFGLEFNYGGLGWGSYRFLSIRAGASHAGASYGLMFNLGILGIEAASQPVDIGAGNEKVIERRMTGTFHVNVADF